MTRSDASRRCARPTRGSTAVDARGGTEMLAPLRPRRRARAERHHRAAHRRTGRQRGRDPGAAPREAQDRARLLVRHRHQRERRAPRRPRREDRRRGRDDPSRRAHRRQGRRAVRAGDRAARHRRRAIKFRGRRRRRDRAGGAAALVDGEPFTIFGTYEAAGHRRRRDPRHATRARRSISRCRSTSPRRKSVPRS